MMRPIAILAFAGICLTAKAQINSNGVHGIYIDGVLVGDVVALVPTDICPSQVICPVCSNSFIFPLGPTNLVISSFTSSNQVLSWSNQFTGLASIEVRQMVGNQWVILTNLPPSATTYTSPPEFALTLYTWQVAGVLPGNNTTASGTTSNVPPPAGLVSPTGLTMSSPSKGTAVLNWTCNGPQVGFWITINGQMTGWGEGAAATSSATYTRTMTGLPSTNLLFGVDAHDAAGNYKAATISGVVQ